MGSLSTSVTPMLPSNPRSSVFEQHRSLFLSRRRSKKKNQAIVPVARLFGPAIFEASKLKVLFLGVDEKKHPGNLPRTYTLTHSDTTSKLTLAISQTINNSQLQGCGGHFLLDWFARLRYFIFCKELPVVLKAFVHGDGNLLKNYPELLEALVWVYFHSNIPEFSKVECWGPLKEAAALSGGATREGKQAFQLTNWELPEPCQENCSCCFPPLSLIPWPQKIPQENGNHGSHYSLQFTNPKSME
ncbi:hypothetical protein SLE2022_088680 [Rubroshorea leprosula]